MLRLAFHSAACVTALAILSLSAASAQVYSTTQQPSYTSQQIQWMAQRGYRPIARVNYSNVAPGQFAYPSHARPIQQATSHERVRTAPAHPAMTPAQQRHYPQLNAAMYPAPQYNIPHQVGGTVITNQWMAPHEMLYGHKYKAMYPPFYYKVKGGRILTPFGFESHETWKLMGTEVNVKYNTKFGLFTGYWPHKFGY